MPTNNDLASYAEEWAHRVELFLARNPSASGEAIVTSGQKANSFMGEQYTLEEVILYVHDTNWTYSHLLHLFSSHLVC